MRRMLFAVGALAAVLIYLIWWVTYAGIHYTPRYAVRPPVSRARSTNCFATASCAARSAGSGD